LHTYVHKSFVRSFRFLLNLAMIELCRYYAVVNNIGVANSLYRKFIWSSGSINMSLSVRPNCHAIRIAWHTIIFRQFELTDSDVLVIKIKFGTLSYLSVKISKCSTHKIIYLFLQKLLPSPRNWIFFLKWLIKGKHFLWN
jgi:hypothetical protein